MLLAATSTSLAATPLETVARHHRLHVPPRPTATLPSSLAVDETEYTLRPSQIVLAAGQVRITVYNRGMDDHDLTVVDASGVAQQVAVKPGESGTLVVALEPGSYRLYCSLFAGTPESHEALGMHKTIEVR
jgi:plastocyanin